jgi:rod shape-determining protein MreB
LCDKSVKIAGDVFTNDIVYMRTQHNLFVGELHSWKIKSSVAAIEDLKLLTEDMSVQGRDLLTGKPKQVRVSYREIAKH